MLADAGLHNALRIKDGKVTQVETDPSKPGFLAEVVPTPTMLIIETDANNEAVEDAAAALDDVEVSQVNGVENARVDGNAVIETHETSLLLSSRPG